MKRDLLTKNEIAHELGGKGEPLSVRSVERYINLAGVKPVVKGSGRGKQAKFSRADVDKIKEAYQKAAAQREQHSTALTTAKTALSIPIDITELIKSNAEGYRFFSASNSEGFNLLSAALDTWPVWLTRSEALKKTGLPAAWFDAGVSAKELQYIGEGRGRRYHRDDLRIFAERLRDAQFLARLLEKTTKR
jgi:hypothetical protein